jgi:LuxR family maltose regulon positive regulatory protein
LTKLVNEIADCGANSRHGSGFILVLDDYYFISDFSIHEAVDFLIDHIPPCMHLVILTRVDPPIPLGRLRVQRTLAEFRQADLQFTVEEATTFLNSLMDLGLSTRDVYVLKDRTEGWIAGLQLAALTLQGRTDKHGQISAFSGSHRHLVDYLAHEVMIRQTEEIQSFLYRTSILERFNASLCDAVMGYGEWGQGTSPDPHKRAARLEISNIPVSHSREILDQLELANLFLIALDDDRQWYRYHHLFADFLNQQLHESQPETIPELFIRASQWYETQGLVDEALEHALRGTDEIRVARILDENAEALLMLDAKVDQILDWVDRLPVNVRAQFPRLCIFHAWALQFEYRLDTVEPTLSLAEAHLAEPTSLPKSFPANLLRGHASAIRAYLAFRKGMPDQAVELSQRALKDLPDENTKDMVLLRGIIKLGLAIGYLQLGELDASYQASLSALPMNQQTGNRYAALSCIYHLIQVDIIRGALDQVVTNVERGLSWIEVWSRRDDRISQPGRMVANFRRMLGEVQYERNELNQAAENLKKACDYYDLARSWMRLDTYAFLADLYQAQGDIDRALSYYRRLKRFSLKPEIALPGVPVDAALAKRSIGLSIVRPDLEDLLADAVRWVENTDLKPTDEFRYEREYEYRVLAHVMLALHRANEVVPLLDKLITSAESGERNGDLIVYLSLQALAHSRLGKSDLAHTHLARALNLAEPEGYVRTFIDLGPPMQNLLQLAVEKDISSTYAAELLAAFPPRRPHTHEIPEDPRPTLPTSKIEPLSERELQILRLIAARLSNREIANELYLSVNTVKWYARSIYEKLDVSNRREAGSQARELGII